MEQLHSILGAKVEHSEGSKSVKDPPGILALCTGAPWFPPLTITPPVQTPPTPSPSVPEKTQVIIDKFYSFCIIRHFEIIIVIIICVKHFIIE
jgi:hypothetical protein